MLHPPRTKRAKQRRVKLLLTPCYFCGGASETWDHLLPVSRGGDNSINNKVPSCYRCNQTKRSRTEMEFVSYILSLDTEHPDYIPLRMELIDKARRLAS
jgi:5-methylcytosine-specific restriction endonuclease McrA